MNAGFRCLLSLALLAATPAFAAKPATPAPSVQLRHMIDTTMAKIGNISNPKQPPFDRTALTTAQADFAAMAQTAPHVQQPMYQAAQTVVANLVGAVEEHEKAAADFRYSQNLHGPQDNKDAKVADWQRGWDAGAAARADNAKQKMENQASRKALLDKEKFLSNGAINSWTERVGQIHDIVEQSYMAELVAEKQLAMLTPPAPLPPPPAPKPAPSQPSAAQQYSPVGTWKAGKGPPLTLKDDGTASRGIMTGTWKWTDQSKGALSISWPSGVTVGLTFPPDGQALTGRNSRGAELNFTRGN